ncbi:MAG: tRNA dihydrouridine synthase DusB [Anaerolineae bacterium]|nr:tRNA dihydrouridine synthase DusB [Anaerolineae bacterium]
MLKSLQIGSLTVDFPLILAPMAGYTELPFRLLCKRYGAGLVFTEVATVEGIARGTPRTLHYLQTAPQERPVGAQVYGTNPNAMAEAARAIEAMGTFDLIDINCGCPVRKIVRHGAGAALMGDPAQIERIVRAVRAATSLPVTVKTRLGLAPHRFDIDEVARAAEAGGADALSVHARFASAGHGGPAQWDALERVRRACSILLIGNGGVRNGQDVLDMLAQTGVDGVMIGRAALGNPWIFDEVRHALENRPYTPPLMQERRAVIVEHLDGLYERSVAEGGWRKRQRATAELVACRKFRAHLICYLAGLPGVSGLRGRLAELNTRQSILDAVDAVLAGAYRGG